MSEVEKAITVNTRASKSLCKSVTDLQKIAFELGNLALINSNLADEIEEKQSDLNQLTELYDAELRKAKAETALLVLEDSDEVLDDLMSAKDYARITHDELDSIQKELIEAKEDNTEATKAAISKAHSIAIATGNANVVQIKALQSVETATLKAKIESLESRLQFLSEINDNLNEALVAERHARIEIARVTQAPVVNVPSSK